ncbi:MAG: hypothetical protein GY838_07020 [bacterium]|nr:hypothetical protein [bacterium]
MLGLLGFLAGKAVPTPSLSDAATDAEINVAEAGFAGLLANLTSEPTPMGEATAPTVQVAAMVEDSADAGSQKPQPAPVQAVATTVVAPVPAASKSSAPVPGAAVPGAAVPTVSISSAPATDAPTDQTASTRAVPSAVAQTVPVPSVMALPAEAAVPAPPAVFATPDAMPTEETVSEVAVKAPAIAVPVDGVQILTAQIQPANASATAVTAQDPPVEATVAAESGEEAADGQADHAASSQPAPLPGAVTAPPAAAPAAVPNEAAPVAQTPESPAPELVTAPVSQSTGDPVEAIQRTTGQTVARAGGAAEPPVAVTRQVTTGLARALSDGASETVRIRLQPEELGRVDVQLTARGGQLQVIMTASTTEAERALRENLAELLDGLGRRVARYQNIDVRVEQREGTEERSQQREEARREATARGNGDQRDSRRQPGREPRTTAEAWADLARGGV